MATLTQPAESPAQTMLRIERQNIARTGEATPTPVTGQITRQGNAATLPTGFGADITGKIFRYDGAGNQSPTPAPVASPITPAASPNTTSAGQSAIGLSGLNIKTPLSAAEYAAQNALQIDEQAIRERVRSEQQAQIDAVNAIYDDMVKGQGRVNDANMGSTRAINARSGLIGSDFGNANDSNQRAAGQQAVTAINRERGLKIAAIFSQIDGAVMEKVAAEKAAALGKAEEYNKYLEKAQGEAKDKAKLLGANGMTFDRLKQEAPDQLKKLLDASGYDEFTLATLMNSGKPPAEQTQYKTQVVGNRVVAYGINPATNQLETLEKELPAGAQANDVKIVDGELWSISPDGKGATKIGGSTEPLIEQLGSGRSMRKVISYDGGKSWKDLTTGAPAARPAGGGGGGRAPAPKKTEKSALEEIRSGIAGANLAGPDGYIAPDTYQSLRSAWVADGLDPANFDKSLKGYVNPNNANYVINKQ